MWIRCFLPVLCIVLIILDTTAGLTTEGLTTEGLTTATPTTTPRPECPSGRFGENCSIPCGQCRDDLPCDVITGVCPTGCWPGWHGQRCFHPCDDGFYGDDCIVRCGFCLGRCEPITGYCPGGCQEGWRGKFCLESLPLPEIRSILLRTLNIVGVVVGVIVIFSLCLCVYNCFVADSSCRKLPDKEAGADSDSVHSGHTVSASAVMMRNMAHKSRALSQLYSVFSWGSDFDDRQQAPKPETGTLYANGQVTLGDSGMRLSQEVPAPTVSGRDPLYQNSDPVKGQYQNWTS